MGLEKRLALYKELETLRGHPLIVYCTSSRVGAGGRMSKDAIPDFLDQLIKLPKRTKSLDLLLVSEGGEPTSAWQIVSLIRERVEHLSVLVPQSAYSAATLIALGADEIVMHPHGNLGPIDPQMTAPLPGGGSQGYTQVQFGSEDMTAFLDYAREELGITDQAHITEIFQSFSKDLGPIAIGAAVRSAELSLSMGEKLLKLHMKNDSETSNAKQISERLNKDFLHHGYPVSRSEAKQIGLNIADSDTKVESLIWDIWCSLSSDMELRNGFNPIAVLAENPECAALFSPSLTVQIPQGLAPEVEQQAYKHVLEQIPVVQVPPTPYKLLHAVLESRRHASHYITSGQIFGTRHPDLSLKASQVQLSGRWETIKLPRAKATKGAKTKPKQSK